MQIPTWLKPALTGAAVGAVATMALGFTQGGWYLGSSAQTMAEKQSAIAVVAALAPICVSQSKADPQAAMKLRELDAVTSSYGRRDFVMKAGWATMPATDAPNRDVAMACAEAIAEAAKA